MLLSTVALATLALLSGADAHPNKGRGHRAVNLATREAADNTTPVLTKRYGGSGSVMTWYSLSIMYAGTPAGQVGAVACGGRYTNGDRLVAMNQPQYNAAWCGRKITLRNNDNGIVASNVYVRDLCPTNGHQCGYGSLDLSPPVFDELSGRNMDAGELYNVEWWFDDEGAPGGSKPEPEPVWTPEPPKPEPTPEYTPPPPPPPPEEAYTWSETSTWTPPPVTSTSTWVEPSSTSSVAPSSSAVANATSSLSSLNATASATASLNGTFANVTPNATRIANISTANITANITAPLNATLNSTSALPVGARPTSIHTTVEVGDSADGNLAALQVLMTQLGAIVMVASK